MGWLFGALSATGLQLPDKFDLQGILSLVLQILGLTYAKFRARAVALVGGPIVAKLEQVAEVFKIFLTEGVSGLWRFIKDQLTDLKSMVLDAIFGFIKERVIIAGITWIIGLLNPASAFFKACKAIYDIVAFFINRGSQIMALVNAVVDSVAAIAKGALSAAIGLVEGALAKTIPVAIGFLASLLGLGDPAAPVRETIERARAPVDKAIDWVINLAVKGVRKGKKLWEKGKEKAIGAGKAVVQIGVPQDPHERLRLAVRASVSAARRLTGKVTQALLNPILAGIKVRYGLQALRPYEKGGTWWVRATINPEVDQPLGVPSNAPTSQAGAGTSSSMAPTPPAVNERHGAQGIGTIGLHGKKPPSLRNGPKIWWMTSEHIIPFATGKRLWEVIGMVIPGRGGHEDDGQTTIMIYYEAAMFKTPDDNRISEAFEGKIAEADVVNRMRRARLHIDAGHPEAVRAEVRAVLGLIFAGLRSARDDAVDRTNLAIVRESNMKMEGSNLTNAERRGPEGAPEPAVPSPVHVGSAAEEQYKNIIDLATSEVEAANILR
jgi:hypothetical protein